MAQVEAIGWGGRPPKCENWGGRFNNTNSITNDAWGASVNACTAYLPRIPVNVFAVIFLASVIDYSFITLCIVSQIFALDNGVLLQSL